MNRFSVKRKITFISLALLFLAAISVGSYEIFLKTNGAMNDGNNTNSKHGTHGGKVDPPVPPHIPIPGTMVGLSDFVNINFKVNDGDKKNHSYYNFGTIYYQTVKSTNNIYYTKGSYMPHAVKYDFTEKSDDTFTFPSLAANSWIAIENFENLQESTGNFSNVSKNLRDIYANFNYMQYENGNADTQNGLPENSEDSDGVRYNSTYWYGVPPKNSIDGKQWFFLKIPGNAFELVNSGYTLKIDYKYPGETFLDLVAPD